MSLKLSSVKNCTPPFVYILYAIPCCIGAQHNDGPHCRTFNGLSFVLQWLPFVPWHKWGWCPFWLPGTLPVTAINMSHAIYVRFGGTLSWLLLFSVNLCKSFTHIIEGCFTGIGSIVWLPSYDGRMRRCGENPTVPNPTEYADGLVQDSYIPSTLPMEMLQSCSKQMIRLRVYCL